MLLMTGMISVPRTLLTGIIANGKCNTERDQLRSHVRTAHPIPLSSKGKPHNSAIIQTKGSNSSRGESHPVRVAIEPPASGHPLIDSSAVAKQQGALGRANYSNRYKPGQKTSDEFQLSPPNTGDENQRTPSCQRAVI